MKYAKTFLKASLIFLVFPILINAAGSIKGTVVDAATDNPLIGANVVLLGTSLGAAVDFDGQYAIRGIPAGTYNVKCSYLGYRTQTLEVQIVDNRTLELNFELVLDVVEGETVIVTAQAQGQAAAINQQLSSNTITNVVSADKILEIPDANAAESVGRLPGISILRDGGEGNKVTIRGLAPTFNAVTIGGDKIPATDLNDRSFDMSMISPAILAGIEVTKALTPDKDADALGGTIDFKLAEAPRGGFKYNVRFQNGYNDQREEFGQYKTSISASNRFVEDKFGILITGNAERTQRGNDEFGVGYYQLREKREGEEFAPLGVDDVDFRHKIDIRERFGFSALLDYQLPFGKLLSNNFFSRLDREEDIRRRRWDTGGNYLRYYWTDRRRQINVLTNSIAGEFEFDFFNVDLKLARTEAATRYPYDSGISIRQSSGFNEGVTAATTVNDIFAAANERIDQTYLYSGTLESEKSLERDLSAQLNFQVPFNVTTWLAGNVKFGGKYRDKLKDRDTNLGRRRLDARREEYATTHTRYGDPDFNYQYIEGSGWASVSNYIDPGFDAGNFLNGAYDFGLGLDGEELNHLVDEYLADTLYRASVLRDINDYNLDEIVTSGYAMAEINLGQSIMLLPGFRYEDTDLEMIGRRGNVGQDFDEDDIENPLISDTTATASYYNWFPMVHLRIKPVEWADLRLAYTETISRPRLSWMLPKVRVHGSQQSVEIGKPQLKPQLATNYDAYLSFYGNEVGLLTIGGFYKDIENLVYLREGRKLLDPVSEGYEANWQGLSLDAPENSPFKTEIYGFEIEWQTNFMWLPSPFDGIVLNINYTHIWSETKYPRSLVRTNTIPVFPFVETTVIDTFRVGDMINQPDDIANIQIGYDYGPFSGRVSMLYQGRTLSQVGERDEDDYFTRDYIRWDFLARYNFTDNLSIYFNLNNFTNEPDEAFRLDEKFLTEQQYYSWTADLGINVRLR